MSKNQNIEQFCCDAAKSMRTKLLSDSRVTALFDFPFEIDDVDHCFRMKFKKELTAVDRFGEPVTVEYVSIAFEYDWNSWRDPADFVAGIMLMGSGDISEEDFGCDFNDSYSGKEELISKLMELASRAK